jgi:hypothetical protein
MQVEWPRPAFSKSDKPSSRSRKHSAADDRRDILANGVQQVTRYGRVPPGVFAHVALDTREPPIPTVPNAAIIIRAGHVLAGVPPHLVPITLDASDGNRTQVTSGLSPGQLVASDVPAEVGDGATIPQSSCSDSFHRQANVAPLTGK